MSIRNVLETLQCSQYSHNVILFSVDRFSSQNVISKVSWHCHNVTVTIQPVFKTLSQCGQRCDVNTHFVNVTTTSMHNAVACMFSRHCHKEVTVTKQTCSKLHHNAVNDVTAVHVLKRLSSRHHNAVNAVTSIHV